MNMNTNSNKEINYPEKILNFHAITEYHDEEQALKFLEFSRQKYEILNMPHQTAIAELEIAGIYLELNLAEEAFTIYKKVSRELSNLKMQSEEACARANFGRVAVILNETKIAKDE